MSKKTLTILAIVYACILLLLILLAVVLVSGKAPTEQMQPAEVTEEQETAEFSATDVVPTLETMQLTTEPMETEWVETEPAEVPKIEIDTPNDKLLPTDPVIETPIESTPPETTTGQPEDPTEESTKNDFSVDFDDLLNGIN